MTNLGDTQMWQASESPILQTLLNQVFTEGTSTVVLSRMGMNRHMGGLFDTGRIEVWRALRKSYHHTFSLANMAVDRLKPAAYVERLRRTGVCKWGQIQKIIL